MHEARERVCARATLKSTIARQSRIRRLLAWKFEPRFAESRDEICNCVHFYLRLLLTLYALFCC